MRRNSGAGGRGSFGRVTLTRDLHPFIHLGHGRFCRTETLRELSLLVYAVARTWFLVTADSPHFNNTSGQNSLGVSIIAAVAHSFQDSDVLMMSSSFSVSGKTAIVTGAGSGINLSFAALLLSRNCNVVLADLTLRPEAETLVAKYSDPESNPRAVFVKTDVTSWPALSNMFNTTLSEFGDVDIVCPGAGVYEPHWSNFWHPPGSSEAKDAVDGEPGHYALLDINLNHPIRVTQLALSHWLHPPPARTAVSPSNPKRIVHISSVASYVPNFNAPLYGASKFAINGFVRSLAALDEQHGIRVNAVAPGVVRTPLWLEHPEKMVNLEPEDGWVTPDEVAAAMLQCAEDSELVGGTIFEVGKDNTRCVQIFNDPGPDWDPKKGLITRNAKNGHDMIWTWLQDNSIWGSR